MINKCTCHSDPDSGCDTCFATGKDCSVCYPPAESIKEEIKRKLDLAGDKLRQLKESDWKPPIPNFTPVNDPEFDELRKHYKNILGKPITAEQARKITEGNYKFNPQRRWALEKIQQAACRGDNQILLDDSGIVFHKDDYEWFRQLGYVVVESNVIYSPILGLHRTYPGVISW